MTVKAKRFEFVAALDRKGTVTTEGAPAISAPEPWKPEHLVLAAVARCTLESLRYYARDATIAASAGMAGVVTRREDDGLYALVEVEVVFDVDLAPEPSGEELAGLLARAQAGCFVGNSLVAKPRYVWRVNGRLVEAAP